MTTPSPPPSAANRPNPISLRPADLELLDAIAEAHRIGKPAVVRIGLARLNDDPPAESESEMSDSESEPCCRRRRIHLRPQESELLDRIAEAHELTRAAVVRIGLARLLAIGPTDLEIEKSNVRIPKVDLSRRDEDPTEEEIRAACLEIQSEWTDEESHREKRNRRGGGRRGKRKPAGWKVPTVRTPAGLRFD